MNILEQVQQNLFLDEAVTAAALMGSVAIGKQDEWSDLDIVVIIDGESRMQWREIPIYGLEEHSSSEMRTLHILYEDMQIIDFVLIQVKTLVEKPDMIYPFQAEPLKILFSRDQDLTALLKEVHSAQSFKPMTEEAFAEFQLRFWYQARYASQRILRDDLLIGLHLALELFQALLVLRMLIRDKEAGRNYHSSGGAGNNYVQQLPIMLKAHTREGILDFMEAIVSEFDELAAAYSLDYHSKKEPMLNFIARLRSR